MKDEMSPLKNYSDIQYSVDIKVLVIKKTLNV
jgi:hypothetical protein